MSFLLDTHLILWAADQPERLAPVLDLASSQDRLLSAASAWELAIKQSRGKLVLGMSVSDFFRRSAIELGGTVVDVTASHAAAVEHLPHVHRDPFDRLLVAQAIELGATLLTADRTLAAYGPVVQLVEGPSRPRPPG